METLGLAIFYGTVEASIYRLHLFDGLFKPTPTMLELESVFPCFQV